MPAPVKNSLPRLWPALVWLCGPFFLAAPALAQTLSEADDLRAISQARLPAQALLNQGAELIYGPALDSLKDQAADGRALAFGGVVGGRQEYEAAGRTKVDGWSFLAGLGQVFTVDESPIARFIYGVFGEGGTGRFETSRAYATPGERKGEGQAGYVGGGFFLKTEFHNNIYMESAFRIGRAKTDLTALALDDPDFRGFDSNGYIGALGGVGYGWAATDLVNLDFYARLRWSHQAGQAGGTNRIAFTLEPLNSTQTLFGAQADFRIGPEVKIFADAAWEHEFYGRQRMIFPWADDFKQEDAPNLKSDSLKGELGLTVTPAGAEGFSARVGLGSAWGGHESLTGSLRLQYEF